MNLTRCQQNVYQALADYLRSGRTPTRVELAQIACCSRRTVSRSLRQLQALGLVHVHCERIEVRNETTTTA